MSSIKVIYDTQTSEISFDKSKIGPYYCDFIAALERHGQRVDIRGLSYGADVRVNGELVLKKSWPPEGVKYVSTDQNELVTERLTTFPPDAECEFSVWVKGRNGEYTGQTTFTIPRPEQLYDSWGWNTETLNWEAPVPYPDDGNDYTWDEENQQWVIPAEPLNINTATAEELESLSGVGASLAQQIIDGRPWEDINDLTIIQDISQEMVDSWGIVV